MAVKKTKKKLPPIGRAFTEEDLWADSINRRVRLIVHQIEELEDLMDNATPFETRTLYEAARSIGRRAQMMMREASAR